MRLHVQHRPLTLVSYPFPLLATTLPIRKGLTSTILDDADKFWTQHQINTYAAVCMKIDIDTDKTNLKLQYYFIHTNI